MKDLRLSDVTLRPFDLWLFQIHYYYFIKYCLLILGKTLVFSENVIQLQDVSLTYSLVTDMSI